jgi:hypothetical protein
VGILTFGVCVFHGARGGGAWLFATAGRVPLAMRYLRHVPVIYVDYPSASSYKQIYGTFNRALLKRHPELNKYAEPLTDCMVDFFMQTQEHFTADMQPFYIYSPREMTRWIKGIKECIWGLDSMTVEDLIRIWAGETNDRSAPSSRRRRRFRLRCLFEMLHLLRCLFEMRPLLRCLFEMLPLLRGLFEMLPLLRGLFKMLHALHTCCCCRSRLSLSPNLTIWRWLRVCGTHRHTRHCGCSRIGWCTRRSASGPISRWTSVLKSTSQG